MHQDLTEKRNTLNLLFIFLDKVSGASPLDNLVINVSDVHNILDRISKIVLHYPPQDVKADVRSVDMKCH